MSKLAAAAALSVVAAVTLAWSAAANAADKAFCDWYTTQALQQVEFAKSHNCPVDIDNPNDPRWSEDPATHDGWCTGLAEDDYAMSEYWIRAGANISCGSCRYYAQQ